MRRPCLKIGILKKETAGGAHAVSLVTATAIVIANMVGTGVFTSLGFQVAELPSGFSLMLLWVVGGVGALCGALAYGELAAALPRSGGEYHFLSAIFHPAVGFVAGWVSATVGFAAPIALAAMAFGKYLGGVIPACPPLVSSALIVALISLVHLRSVKMGSAFQNIFTLLKITLILAFVAAGFVFAQPQPISFAPAARDFHFIFSAPFAVSMVYVMYSYSGWNASTYIVGEIGEPQKNVPRSLFLGTMIVLVLYLALNAAFLRTTPTQAFAGQIEVGLIAGKHLFGELGGRLMGALISVVLISSISSMTWIGPRVMMTMGEDIRALRLFAWKTKRGVPAVALLFQFAVVIYLVFREKFEIVLIYVQFTLILSSFLTVLGLFVLRIKQPDLPRPYKTWGYPVTPLIFLAISLFMMFHILTTKPMESIAGLGTMLLGLLIYFLSPKNVASRVLSAAGEADGKK